MTHLIYDDVMSVQRNFPADLQVIVLQFRPHQPGGGLHHLPQGLRLGHHHVGAVVQPERALVVTADHQTDALVAAQVHVEVVRVGPLQVGQHGHVLLYDFVLFCFIIQRFGSRLKKKDPVST